MKKFTGPKMPRAMGSAPGGAPRAPVALPAIERLEPTDASPSILLIGGSGTGKTYAIGRLLEKGLKGLILAVEPKLQTIAKYRWSTGAVLFTRTMNCWVRY